MGGGLHDEHYEQKVRCAMHVMVVGSIVGGPSTHGREKVCVVLRVRVRRGLGVLGAGGEAFDVNVANAQDPRP